MDKTDLMRALTALGAIPIERVEEICDAERDGRVVVLPCKVGDTVYVIEREYTVCHLGTKCSDGGCGGCNVPCDSYEIKTVKARHHQSLITIAGFIQGGCFGKTVFLTRAQAEEALKGGTP